MKMILCSLKDTAVGAFMVPQAVAHKNSMIRALSDALAKKEAKADYIAHPEDFELYEVGVFDDQTGVTTPPEGGLPVMLIRLKDLVSG